MSAIPAPKSLGLEDWRQLKVSLALWYRSLIPVLERSKGIQVSFDLRLASLVYIVRPEQPESHTVRPWSQMTKQNKLCTRQSCHRKHSSQGSFSTPWVLQRGAIRAVTGELAEQREGHRGTKAVWGWTQVSWGVAVHTAKDEGFCSPAPDLVLCPYVYRQFEASCSTALIRDTIFGSCTSSTSPLRNLRFFSPLCIYCSTGQWPGL